MTTKEELRKAMHVYLDEMFDRLDWPSHKNGRGCGFATITLAQNNNMSDKCDRATTEIELELTEDGGLFPEFYHRLEKEYRYDVVTHEGIQTSKVTAYYYGDGEIDTETPKDVEPLLITYRHSK